MSSSTPLYDLSEVRAIGADPWLETCLDHPEDVAVSETGLVYAGGEDGQLYTVDPVTNRVTEIGRVPGFVLGVELGPDGNLYACDFQRHAVFRQELEDGEPIGEPDRLLDGGPDRPPLQPNAMTFDRAGRLYVSDSGCRDELPGPFDDSDGLIVVRDPDGSTRVLTDRVPGFPNGLALSNDEATLYVCETGPRRIVAVDLEDGGATGIETVTADCGVVDGVALDARDRLYVASIGDNAVYRVDDGTVEPVVHDPEGLLINNPTNVAFGGADWQTLYIANLGLHHITAIDIEAEGRRPTARKEA